MNELNNPAAPTRKDASSGPEKKPSRFWQIFWLSFLVISLAYAWYSFYVPSNDVVWAENMGKAQELAADSGKDIMIFFTGDWCVPCRIMKREVFADRQVAEIINSQVVPVMISVDDPKEQDLVKLYKAGVTPLTIFTNSRGEVLDYAVGKTDKAYFLEMMEKLKIKES